MLLLQKTLLKKDRHKRHIENFAGVPGVIYNFNTKNLISFQVNFNAKGDLPFVLNFDFETTARQIIASILNKRKCLLCLMF